MLESLMYLPIKFEREKIEIQTAFSFEMWPVEDIIEMEMLIFDVFGKN